MTKPLYSIMINGITTLYPRGLNEKFGLNFMYAPEFDKKH